MFEIGDLLVVAERLLGIDAERLKLVVNIPSAESALAAPFAGVADQMFYEHPVQRAAILAELRLGPLAPGDRDPRRKRSITSGGPVKVEAR